MIETGINFDDIHSFYDLNLILSAVEIPPALPKVNYIDIPGGDGTIDLTEANGEVRYYDRDGCKFTFSVHPSETMSFEAKKTQVANALNGKYFDSVVLDKDSEYQYSGRCTVNEWLQDKNLKQIIVTAIFAPYKLKRSDTVVSIALTETPQIITLMNSKRRVVPVVTCTGGATIETASGSYNLSPGTYDNLYEIYLSEGSNGLKVYGSGTVTFTYREGDL